jgi:hypothetical protein
MRSILFPPGFSGNPVLTGGYLLFCGIHSPKFLINEGNFSEILQKNPGKSLVKSKRPIKVKKNVMRDIHTVENGYKEFSFQ